MSFNAGTVYSEMVLDLSKYERSLKDAEKGMDGFVSNIEKAGQKMEKAGKQLTTKVTLPLVGIGTAASKVGMDFEAGMSEVQALSGATGEDLKRLEDIAKAMGSTTKFSASQSAEGLKYMALAGWDVNEMVAALPGVLDLAASANMDLAQASDIVTDTMSAFMMSAEEAGYAADMFSKTQASSNTNVMQLGEAMKYAGSAANAANMDLAQTNAVLGILADSGIKGSMAGTTFTAMLRDLRNNALDGSVSVGDMSIALYDAEGNMRDLGTVMSDIELATKDMTSAQRDMHLGALFGEQAIRGVNIMLATGADKYSELEYAIRNSDGAAKDMADTMQDNLRGSFTRLMSGLEGAGIQIFEVLVPHLEKVVEKTQAAVDWFSKLDPKTQETIVKIGGLVAALGPLLLIGGKITKGIGPIITVFGKLTGATAAATAATGGAASSIGLLGTAAKAGTLLLNPWVLGIAAATAAGIGLYKHLNKESIPEIDLFGDAVSDSTAKAVEAFLDLNDKATLALNELNWSGREVTDEMVSEISGKFDGMKDQVLSTLNEQHQESYNQMKDHFANSSALTEDEEALILEKMKTSHEEKKSEVEEYNQRIKNIMETASEEKRALTKEEQEEINEIQSLMVENGIKALSENELESKAILERMKAQASDITAKQAAEVVKNSVYQKDKAISAAEEQYNESIKTIIKQRDEYGTITKEQADRLIEEATRQRNESVAIATDMHENIILNAKEQAHEHVNQVDWETGEILTKWEAFKVSISNTWDDVKRSASEAWGNVRESISSSMDRARVKLDEGINKIREWNNLSVREKVFSIVENIKRVFTGSGDTSAGVEVGSNALGTSYWGGGLTWVGEYGPELIDLPPASKVYNSSDSMKKTSASAPVEYKVENHYHIGSLIGDDYSLKLLERKLGSIRRNEETRLGAEVFV